MKRHLGALHEEHMAGLKAISEQFIDVNRKLDSHDQKLDSHTEMIGGLAVRVTNVETKLGRVEVKIERVEAKMDTMEMKMTVMQEDIQFIKSGLKRKVDQDEFDALVRRVSVIEKRAK